MVGTQIFAWRCPLACSPAELSSSAGCKNDLTGLDTPRPWQLLLSLSRTFPCRECHSLLSSCRSYMNVISQSSLCDLHVSLPPLILPSSLGGSHHSIIAWNSGCSFVYRLSLKSWEQGFHLPCPLSSPVHVILSQYLLPLGVCGCRSDLYPSLSLASPFWYGDNQLGDGWTALRRNLWCQEIIGALRSAGPGVGGCGLTFILHIGCLYEFEPAATLGTSCWPSFRGCWPLPVPQTSSAASPQRWRDRPTHAWLWRSS